MKSNSRIFAVLALLVATPVFVSEASEDFELPLEIVNLKKKPPEEEKFFYVLPLVKRLEGSAMVREVGTEDWVTVEEGRHYQLGSSFRTEDDASKLVVALGRDCLVTVSKERSEFETKFEEVADRMKSRTVRLIRGKVDLRLPLNLPAGKVSVSSHGFEAKDLAGESRFFLEQMPDNGDRVYVKCISGVMKLVGRHFEFPAMRVASVVCIRTTSSGLFTGLYGMAGDSVVKLDQGVFQKKDFETNEVHEESKTLDWKLSPKTAVRIHRRKTGLSDRMGVTVMTFTAEGKLKNRCAFAEGLYCLNTGEQGPTTKAEKEEIAKKAAQAAEAAQAGETITEEADVEDDAADSSGSMSDDSDSSSAMDDDFEF